MRTLKLAILLALICTISSWAKANIYMECSLPNIRGELKIVEGWWSDKVYIEKEGQVGWEKLDSIVNDDNIIIDSHNDYQIDDVKFSDRFGDNVSSGYCSRKCDMKYSISLMPKNDKDTIKKNYVEVKEFNANDCDVPAQVWRFVEFTNEELNYKSNKCNEIIKEWNSSNGVEKINREQFLNKFKGKSESIILDELYKKDKKKTNYPDTRYDPFKFFDKFSTPIAKNCFCKEQLCKIGSGMNIEDGYVCKQFTKNTLFKKSTSNYFHCRILYLE